MDKKKYYYGFTAPKDEKIICAAVKLKEDIICGFRHGECFNILLRLYSKDEAKDCISGFLTNYNRFVDRKEGWIIADKMNQIITPNRSDEDVSELFEDGIDVDASDMLMSEDLW